MLVIEDEPLAQQVFSATLAGACELVQVETLAEGIAFLHERADAVHAVLLDLILPNGEGLAVVKQLKLSFPEVPVVVVTGMPASDPTDEQLLGAGVQEVVRKPNLNADILLSAMAHAIARTQWAKQMRQPMKEAMDTAKDITNQVLRKASEKMELGKSNG